MLDPVLRRFRDALADSHRLACVIGYAINRIGNAAAIWSISIGKPGVAAMPRPSVDELAPQGLRPATVSGYGDGFHPA